MNIQSGHFSFVLLTINQIGNEQNRFEKQSRINRWWW